MPPSKSKNIIAIESWDNQIFEPKIGMRPLIEFCAGHKKKKYSYNNAHTPQEISYLLSSHPASEFGLIYFSMHGDPSKIYSGISTEFTTGLGRLATAMGKRFKGYGLHFASCAVLFENDERIKAFKKRTGLSFVSGYTKYVDFYSSSVLDMALILKWMSSHSNKRTFGFMEKTHPILIKQNGFKYFL